MMIPEETAKNYNQIATYWSSPNFDRNNGIVPHQRVLTFLKNKERAIDVGCGSSGRIIDFLLENGFDVKEADI